MSSSNKQSQWVADGWEQPLQNAGLLDIDSLSDREINDSEQQTTAYVKIYANKRHLFQRIFRSAQSRIEVRNLLFIRSIGTPNSSNHRMGRPAELTGARRLRLYYHRGRGGHGTARQFRPQILPRSKAA